MAENRRMEDLEDISHQAEIERLIAAEQDPQARIHLMILNRINLSIVANTVVTKHVVMRLDEHITKFNAHTKEQDEMVNKGKGAGWLFIKVMAVVQILGVGAGAMVMNDIKDLHSEVISIATEQARRAERLRFLEDIVMERKNDRKP